MIRTPTTSVTAIDLAARAFAWDSSVDVHRSGLAPEMQPPSMLP